MLNETTALFQVTQMIADQLCEAAAGVIALTNGLKGITPDQMTEEQIALLREKFMNSAGIKFDQTLEMLQNEHAEKH